MKPFDKSPHSIDQQLEKLISRGMLVPDRKKSKHYLNFISYYRFCGYAIEFEDQPRNGEKRYLTGSTFNQVLDIYFFDRKLRLHLMDAIERIEIGIRTVIMNELSMRYGAHWYLDSKLFIERFNHSDFVNSVKIETRHKKREPFLNHYYGTYNKPELPASWMVAEILSFGTWSKIFARLINRDDQKQISRHFNIDYNVMTSWLHTLTYLRNLCAHHSKIWNRVFTLTPLIAKKYHDELINNRLFSAQAAIVKILLDVVSPGNHWGSLLGRIVDEHPLVDLRKMGFDTDSFKRPFWYGLLH